MANEATLIFETDVPIPFAVDEALAVEKGTLLTLIHPMKVSKHSAAHQIVAGIAAEEHIANSGKDKIAVYRRGIFKLTLSGAHGMSVGQTWKLAATANTITGINAGDIYFGGMVFETEAGGSTLLAELHPFNISQ